MTKLVACDGGAGFGGEIAQDAGEAALRAAGRVVEVVPVEPRSVVEAQRDGVVDRGFRRLAEQHVDDARQRHDAQAGRDGSRRRSAASATWSLLA